MNDRDEPSHAREWRWPVGFEINVNSRHPVMRDVPLVSAKISGDNKTQTLPQFVTDR